MNAQSGRELHTRRSSTGAYATGTLVLWTVVLAGCTGEADRTTDDTPPGTIARAASSIPAQAPPPLHDRAEISFSDIATERGIRFTWPEQPRPMRALEAFGCGCAAFDGDNDGWQDVLLVGAPHPALFRNAGGGIFENVTAASGLKSLDGDWKGCAIGDYDGDGLLDVLLTGYHGLALYRNRGGLQFEIATEMAGLDPANHGHWGASAGFMDLDGDGWLDLVIVNYVVFGPESQQYCEYTPGVRSGCTPRSYPPERAEIWRNDRRGAFERVPDAAGMDQTTGVGLVLAFVDLDDDGKMDFYIGNDAVPADFLHNLGDMRFENIASHLGMALGENAQVIAAMGADWGDYDRDGRLDLALTNFQWLSFVLFRNGGGTWFGDVASRTGIAGATRNRLGFGAKWADFDNDGWPDLFFVNGHVYDNARDVQPGAEFRQPICLFQNIRGRQFVDLAPGMGADVRRTMVGRGSATADFDNDGRVDLLAVDYEGPAMLLENRTRTENHWLKLDLRGSGANVFAYGARVVGHGGGQTWISDVSPASSYLSSSDPRIHWGLGNVARLETVVIRWPSGNVQTLRNVEADRILPVVESP